jgi:hypothetical protein
MGSYLKGVFAKLVRASAVRVTPASECEAMRPPAFTPEMASIYQELMPDPNLQFLKEHKKVENLEKDLQATIVQQQKQIEALTTGLQKVSAQLEASKLKSQVVAK